MISSMLDEVDRGLIHALHIDGRAPFNRIGEVLGVSTQTVTRRYRRLRNDFGLRVVGLPDPGGTGSTQWLVRLTSTPATARQLAQALARRPETSWVMLTSGGTEVFLIVEGSGPDAPALLLDDLPRTSAITGISAHYVLHTYLGGPTAWPGRLSALDAEQQRNLLPQFTSERRRAVSPTDETLFAALRDEGRATLADLADATGWSQSTVARRISELRGAGALFLDVEVDDRVLGVGTRALLWATIAPGQLDTVAKSLARHPELAFVAATTGRTNLIAEALCPDPAALHRYLTERLGEFDAIHTLETAPVLATVKATSPLHNQPPPRRR